MLLLCAACRRDLDMLEPAPFPTEPEVFYDDFGPGVQYAAFAGSKVDALDIEYEEVYRGAAALKFTVPSTDDPSGGFAGRSHLAQLIISGDPNTVCMWTTSTSGGPLPRPRPCKPSTPATSNPIGENP